MVGGQGGWRLESDRDSASAPPLGLAKVKAIAQQDESIGRMGVGAISLIARCTDAFLADLVMASADRARAAGHREPNKKIRKRPATSSNPPPQQVLPEDVRKAVAEEERFDFLRPILNPPQDSSDSLGAAAAGAKGKRKSDPTSGRAGTAGAGARKGKKRMDAELADAAGMGAASASDIQPSGSAMASAAGAGSGGLLALAGLDEEGRRRALLGVMESKPPAASGLGDDEDEDYDNY